MGCLKSAKLFCTTDSSQPLLLLYRPKWGAKGFLENIAPHPSRSIGSEWGASILFHEKHRHGPSFRQPSNLDRSPHKHCQCHSWFLCCGSWLCTGQLLRTHRLPVFFQPPQGQLLLSSWAISWVFRNSLEPFFLRNNCSEWRYLSWFPFWKRNPWLSHRGC